MINKELFLFSLLLISVHACSSRKPLAVSCETIPGGPQVNVTCVFPFKIKNDRGNDATYVGCTLDERSDIPWCSTKVDELGFHVGKSNKGHWGYCGQECPLDTSQT